MRPPTWAEHEAEALERGVTLSFMILPEPPPTLDTAMTSVMTVRV